MQDATSDTENTSTQDISTETPGPSIKVESEFPNPADTDPTNQADDKQPYKPFGNGKEKFKVDGREVEWDFETAKRWAQHGYAGRRAMQEKAEMQKKHQDFYNQLIRAADSDLDGLYEVLTGKKRSGSQATSIQSQTLTTEDPNAAPTDPRLEQMMQAMKSQEEQLRELKEERESRLVDQEAKAIETEFSDVEKKFPEISGNKYLKHYIKTQYAAELRNGNFGVTIEDVAFFVTQEMKDQEQAKQARTKEVLAQKKAKASLPSQKPGSEGTPSNKFQSFDDVRKLAGLLPG